MPSPTVQVTVRLSDFNGPAIAGIDVYAALDRMDATADGIFISTAPTHGLTDETGTVVLDCFPCSVAPAGLGTRGAITAFKAKVPGSRDLYVRAVIPNVDCNLVDIRVDGEPVGIDGASAAQAAAQAAAAQTLLDRAATGADRVQTGLDLVATGEDRVATGLDRVAVEAVAGNIDGAVAGAAQVALDRVATAADRVQTGADRVATGQDRVATSADHLATGQDKAATAADRVQTALDRTVTGADRVAVNADRVVVQGISTSFGDVNAAITAATAQAAISTTQAGLSAGSAGASAASSTSATAAKVAAELARDASFALGPKYATEALGRAAVADGAVFLVQGSGDIAAYEYRRTNSSTSVLIATYPSAAGVYGLIADVPDSGSWPRLLLAAADSLGNVPLAIEEDGTVFAGVLRPDMLKIGTSTETSEFVGDPQYVGQVVTDAAGNVLSGVPVAGDVMRHERVMFGAIVGPLNLWHTLNLATSESIAHIGDSYTASHYTLKDKAFISLISALSPYRHRQFGVSGEDATDMAYRIVNRSRYEAGGVHFAEMAPRFAVIADHTNSSPFRSAALAYWQENLGRLVEAVRAEGTEPLLSTEFTATIAERGIHMAVASQYGTRFIDNTRLNYELGVMQVSYFWQGHPGTRSNGVMWHETMKAIDALPRPEKSIKIYRHRSTFNVATVADLLYRNRLERTTKWKELTVGHQHIAADSQHLYDELNGAYGPPISVYIHTQAPDEYDRIQAKQSVIFTDYALVEIILPGTSKSLDDVEIAFGLAGTATVYVRDALDAATALAANPAPTTPDYLAKWDKPRGAWRSLGAYTGPITFSGRDLRGAMSGDQITLMVYGAGGFTVNDLQVRYRGMLGKPPRPMAVERRKATGGELLAKTTLDTLTGWTVGGAPVTLVPLDNYNSPRLPTNTAVPVAGVCVLTATDTVAQTVTLPDPGSEGKRYRLIAVARHFPKAFIDNTSAGLPPAQVINRAAGGVTFAADSLINTDTCDLRMLKLEWTAGAVFPVNGGAQLLDYVSLTWRLIEFDIDMPPLPLGGTSITFRLSCPDGAVQLAKASFKELA